MINNNRYKELEILFANHEIALPDEDIRLYADLFEVISYFIHDKLDNEEIFITYDFLTDLLEGNKPQIATAVSKDDRIRIQLRVMEELPQTAGKLDMDEKEAFAFCVYYSICVQYYDEEKNQMLNGLVEFSSIEKAVKMLEWEKSQRPDFFKLKDNATADSKYEFGYTKENPIRTSSISSAYEYLNKMRYKNNPIKYNRLCSVSGINDTILDAYEVIVNEKIFFIKKERKFLIYIDSYSDFTSKSTPKGFTLV